MSDEGHIHIYVPDLEQPNHGRCVCGRDGTPSSYDWWKTAIAQAASLAEARRRAEIAEVDTRQLEAVDAALPEWKGTGRGRVETISRLRDELAEARRALKFTAPSGPQSVHATTCPYGHRIHWVTSRLGFCPESADLACVWRERRHSAMEGKPPVTVETVLDPDTRTLLYAIKRALGRPAPDGEPHSAT